MADLVELKFTNSDARPKVETVHVSAASVAPIMDWYGAFYAGDRYRVTVDGKHVAKDRNGAVLPSPTKTAGGK